MPILIFANKQDLAEAIRADEMTEMLGLIEYVNKKPTPLIKVQESSAVQDRGLLDGFEWIVDRIVQIGQ